MSRRKYIESEIRIAAPPHAVWNVLMNTAEWSQWNPSFFYVGGPFLSGERVEVHLWISSQAHLVVHPKVVDCDPVARTLAWEGVVTGPAWQLQSWHVIRLEDLGRGGTRFVQSELLCSDDAPIVRWLGQVKATVQGCRRMNEALKHHCERVAA